MLTQVIFEEQDTRVRVWMPAASGDSDDCDILESRVGEDNKWKEKDETHFRGREEHTQAMIHSQEPFSRVRHNISGLVKDALCLLKGVLKHF